MSRTSINQSRDTRVEGMPGLHVGGRRVGGFAVVVHLLELEELELCQRLFLPAWVV